MLATRQMVRFMVALAVSGCGDDPVTQADACAPDVSLTIGATTPPAFTWQPDCGVNFLSVLSEGGRIAWSIVSEPQEDFTPTNNLRSGITYGLVPTGARQFSDLELLQPDQTYQVRLWISDSQGESTLVGSASFIAITE